MKGMTKSQYKILGTFLNPPFAVRNLTIVEDNLIILVQSEKGFQDIVVNKQGLVKPIKHKQT